MNRLTSYEAQVYFKEVNRLEEALVNQGRFQEAAEILASAALNVGHSLADGMPEEEMVSCFHASIGALLCCLDEEKSRHTLSFFERQGIRW